MQSGDVQLAHPRTGATFDSPVPPGAGWPGDPATPHTAIAESPAQVASMAAAVQTVEELDALVSVCRGCPRLVEWREQVAVAKRKSFAGEPYWGRPVPGWGSARPRVMVVGLAPAAHGGNRTGRVFTGDRSGDVLFAALHRAGLATSALCVDAADGLALNDTRVAAAVRCAPPGNAPTPPERAACAPWLDAEWRLTGADVRVIVALGAFAWRAALQMIRTERRLRRPARSPVRTRRDRHAAHPARRGHPDRLLSPEPAEHVHRQAHPGHARRRVPASRRGFTVTNRGKACTGVSVDAAMRLSVLDLVPVRTDQSTSDALAATTHLAQTADRLGYTRYWLAEHHNMPAVAATSPPVLIAHLAAQTSQLRLGSGGVMLPNHAPLAVAEQFALLEAAHPGRIDLGIGRAPGSDPITSIALRGPAGRNDQDIEQFPQYLDDVMALMSARGVRVALRRDLMPDNYILKATPAAVTEPKLWLLGSSMYSAHLAAAKGLPYVFAHHFSGQGTAEALQVYRSEFVPSEMAPEPGTFLTVNAVVAETRDEAMALMLPNLQMMARLRTGQPLGALDLVEDAEQAELSPQTRAIVDAGLRRAVVGSPTEAADQMRALAEDFGVDEVMVNPVASARRGTDPATAPARDATLELLAKELF